MIDARAASALRPGDHGTTFGGSPVPCAAALAHLRERDRCDLDDHVATVGRRLFDGLRQLAQRLPEIFEPPRGRGLMAGVPVREPYVAKKIVDDARDGSSFLLNAAGDNALRFVPPLIVSETQMDDMLRLLADAVRER